MIVTKNLYTQIVELIEKKSTSVAQTTTSVLTSSSSEDLASLVNTASTDDVLHAVSDILANIVESRIIDGLEVTETDPVSSSILIKAGSGTAYGKYYVLDEDITIPIPFTQYNEVYFVNLYSRGIVIEKKATLTGLTIAKIVTVPNRAYNYIYNDNNNVDAYIQSYKKYNLYGINEKLEEDSIELLRDNIGAILADNIIGNLRLSENLKIINTSGTLELNSDSLKFNSYSGITLTRIDPTGIFFNRADGVELAKFSISGARIGNIVINPSYLSSGNFSAGVSGFKISDTGNAEFNDVTVRGTIYATAGEIGGWTIADNEIYATTTGTIKTSATAGSGSNGVVFDKDGIRGYNATLGTVFNLPTDGSAPTFSSGIINSTIFNINTNSIIRTSSTVGDGTSSSAGILINDTGIYGVGANQTTSNANFRVLTNGNAYFSGTINASAGNIGGVTITETSLSGGLIEGSTLRGTVIETSATVPRIRIDEDGIYYQISTTSGVYDTFEYGDGTTYGTGASAYLFNVNYPILTITQERTFADIRLYNRTSAPASGTHELGDLICVNGVIKRCSSAGSPGTFSDIGVTAFTGLSDVPSSYSGQSLKSVRVNAGETALEFYTPTTPGDMFKSTYDSGNDGIIDVAAGGTGLSSYTQGDLLYASGTTTIAKLTKNTSSTRYLSNTGSSNNPAWAQVDLTNGVTGTLPVSNGGTGTTSLTDIGLPSQTGNSGKYLTTNGTSSSWATITQTVGWNLVSTTSMSGASSSNISFDSTKIYKVVIVVTNSTGGSFIHIQFNGDTASNYTYVYRGFDTGATAINGNNSGGTTFIRVASSGDQSSVQTDLVEFTLYPQGTTSTKHLSVSGTVTSSVLGGYTNFYGRWTGSATATYFNVLTPSGTKTATIYLYELKTS